MRIPQTATDRMRRPVAARAMTWTVVGVSLLIQTGCPTVPPGPDEILEDGNQDPNVTSGVGKTRGEPNGTFDDPIVAVFDVSGVARLQGTVTQRGDLDVFLLGPLNRGDGIVIDAETPNSVLDSSLGLFDELERLVYENDDRGGTGSRVLDSLIEFVVRHDGEDYYLVATNAAFAEPGDRAGTYRITVRVTPGAEVPDPVGQVLFLDFNGATIDSPVLGSRTLSAFNAADIAPVYAGETGTMKASIIATMEQNYERFSVSILTSDDGPPPAGIEFTTMFFGGFNAGAYGIAEDVDLYNADPCDDGLIFIESFELGFFSFTPSAERMGLAIGNVAAHEAGHLLGLNHTEDDLELMDDESRADAFLADQEFGVAPLSSDIMRIGFQDAVTLLAETVGLRPGQSTKVIPWGATVRAASRPHFPVFSDERPQKRVTSKLLIKSGRRTR